MKALSKVQMLVQTNGWSIARAQGFVDGETSRRRGAAPSAYARVGIDDYSLGFRAAYFERGTTRSTDAAIPLPPVKNPVAVGAAPGGRAESASHQLLHLDDSISMQY